MRTSIHRGTAAAAIVCATVVAASVALSAGQGAPVSRALLIKGGTLIDGTGAPARPSTAVLVSGSTIKEVGPSDALAAANKGATVIDATGKYVLPGLIDQHVHYVGWETAMYPYYGVTTVYDLGNLTEWIVAQRDDTNAGLIPGPRLYTPGNHLNGPAKSGDEIRAADFAGWVHIVTDRPSTLAAIDTLLSHHVDALKIQERLSEESLKTIVEAANEHHLPIVGHVTNARTAAEMGIKFIEHMYPIARATSAKGLKAGDADMEPEKFDDLIALFVQKGVFVNPTLMLDYAGVSRHREEWLKEDAALGPQLKNVRQYLKEGWIDFCYTVKPGREAQTKEGFRKASEFLTRFVKAGGIVLTGTDAGRRNVPGLSLHQEMEILVEAGLSPMDVIKGSTIYAARFFGKEREIGSVEAGKNADLLILDGDPLANIANTRKIAYVVHNGQVVKRSLDYKNPLPRPVSDEPAPILLSDLPFRFVQGQKDAVLTLTGKNFIPDSLVQFGSEQLTPTRQADGSLRVTVPAALVAKVGTYPVSVVNPWPAGGQSNTRYFMVDFSKQTGGTK